jgi:hypothetical protein
MKHSQRAGARGVVLAPTRELALQTARVVRELGKHLDLRVATLVGGDSMEAQFAELAGAAFHEGFCMTVYEEDPWTCGPQFSWALTRTRRSFAGARVSCLSCIDDKPAIDSLTRHV